MRADTNSFILFHLYEISKIGKTIEIEKLVVAGA